MVPQCVISALVCASWTQPAAWQVAENVLPLLTAAAVTPKFTQSAPAPKLVTGRLLRVHRTSGHTFRQRLQVQTSRGSIVDFEFLPNGVATRNDQPARLIDLQPGDRILLHQLDPEAAAIVRIDAESD